MAIHDRLAAEVAEAEAAILAGNTDEPVSTEDAVYEAESEGEVQEDSTPGEQEAEPVTDWEAEAKLNEQRNKVLQGKYNAELPRERARAEAAEARADAAETELKESHNQRRDDEGDDYGSEDSEYPEFDERYASKKEFADLKTQEDTRMQQQNDLAQNSMFQQLDALQPDWRDVNTDQGFLDWLGQYDSRTGVQRQQQLSQAESAFDATGIALVISEWKATQRTTSQPDLSRKVTPKNSAGSTPQGKATYSAAEAGLYIEGRNPGYLTKAGRGMDAQQFERELFAAEAEGRLI